jgi:hypothetical protein
MEEAALFSICQSPGLEEIDRNSVEYPSVGKPNHLFFSSTAASIPKEMMRRGMIRQTSRLNTH